MDQQDRAAIAAVLTALDRYDRVTASGRHAEVEAREVAEALLNGPVYRWLVAGADRQDCPGCAVQVDAGTPDTRTVGALPSRWHDACWAADLDRRMSGGSVRAAGLRMAHRPSTED